MQPRRGSSSCCWGQAGETRVVRGGSWINNQRNVRCAYRNRNNPDNRNNNQGFRVVVSHDLPEQAGNAVRSRADGRGRKGEPARLAPGRGAKRDPGQIYNRGRLLGDQP